VFGGGLRPRVAPSLLSQFAHIRDMDDPFAVEQARRRRPQHRLERLPQQLDQRFRQAAHRYGAEFASVFEL